MGKNRVSRRDADKERRWRRLIGEQKQSGQSVREFCRERDLREDAFYRWRKMIKRRDQEVKVTRLEEPALVPVVVVEESSGDAKSSAAAVIEILLGGGAMVRVPCGSTGEQLSMVLDALGRSRC